MDPALSVDKASIERPCVPQMPRPGMCSRVLVTGATGYIGGRLIPALLAEGHSVRAASRSLQKLEAFDWSDDVEKVEADLDDADSLTEACRGVDVVLYLVHSMAEESDFEDMETRGATNLAAAADRAGVRQIVYLSGLVPEREAHAMSAHMRSRTNVGRVLLAARTPALVLRAGVIIGSGSAPFEIIRHLTERLPVMLAPRWITNRIEPIAVCDALYYLTKACGLTETVNDTLDIGCGEVYEFGQLLTEYGRVRGLRRVVQTLPVPFVETAGWWVGLVTPIPRRLAIPLARSMSEDAVTADHRIAEIIPDPPGGFIGYRAAVVRALAKDRAGIVPTTWYDEAEESGDDDAATALPTDPQWSGGAVYVDAQTRETDVDAATVWQVIEGIGGQHGWYSAPLLWRIRGWMDRLVGGPGLGGRRDPLHLRFGDRVDWWRVEAITPGCSVMLRALMRVNGRAWLELAVEERAGGGSVYTQRAIYRPAGLSGRLYWYSVLPFHRFIFPAMAKNITDEAERRAAGAAGADPTDPGA